MMLVGYAIPALSLALVAGAVVGRRMSDGLRRATMAGAILIACGAFTLLRTGGVTGGGVRICTGDGRLHPRSGSCRRPKTSRCRSARPPGAAPATGGARRRRLRQPLNRRSPPAPAAPPPPIAGMARISGRRARRHRSRRPNRHRLVAVPAGADLAPADRTGLVVVRGPRRPSLHAGAARGRGDRRLLQGGDGRSRYGGIATRSGSGNRMAAPARARRRRSRAVASTPWVRPES